MTFEDISLKKREIEAKLEEEKASIQWLKDSLQKSDHLANNMVTILTSFEERLCKLEDTILPVHKETTDLQRRQENVDKTLYLLDEVLSYHNVASNMKPLVEEGPSGKLEEYLQNMEKIDQAIQFFEKNNPESIEKSVLISLSESARDNLIREFSMLLKRNSKAVPAVTMNDILNTMAENADTVSEIDPDDIQIQHFSEKVMSELGTIATWLTEHKKGTDFMNLYYQYRSSNLLLSLENVKKEGVSFNYESIVGKKKPPLKRQVTDVVKKRLGPRKSTKQVIETLYGHKRTPSNFEQAVDEDENSEVSTFITCTAALLKLMQSEKQLMRSIIPEERQIPIFSQLLQDTLNSYTQDAEALCSTSRTENPLDHSSVQILLPVLKYLYTVKDEFVALLKEKGTSQDVAVKNQMVNVDTRTKFLNVISLFEDTYIALGLWSDKSSAVIYDVLKEKGTSQGVDVKNQAQNALHEFVEKLKEADKHVVMPKDGTVHQITSNVTVFLDELIQYLDTTAVILSKTSDANQKRLSMDEHDSQKIISAFVSQVLSVLSLNLMNKSKNYDTSALQSIFMLNNYNYILKSLHKIGAMTMLQEHGQPDLEKEYDDAIEEEMNTYSRSWDRVVQHLVPDATDKSVESAGKAHLKDKHKQAIKDKFKNVTTIKDSPAMRYFKCIPPYSCQLYFIICDGLQGKDTFQCVDVKVQGFNTDFDEIRHIHKEFTLPDNSLKKLIYTRICELIVTKYADFLKRYRDVHFTKNVEKYVKYDVDKVRTLIANIYDIQP